jgi:hypothetical protein
MKLGIQEIVDTINDGNLDEVLPYFNDDINILFRMLKKYGGLNQIDPFDSKLEDYQNQILNTLLNELNDADTWKYAISKIDGDIDRIGDDFYLVTTDITDLSELFKGGYRNDYSPEDIAKSVLSEDWWVPFYNTTEDIYSDVIQNLNEENLKYLKQKFIEELPNTISIYDENDFAHTDLLEELGEEQNTQEIQINQSNIDRIFNDEETIKYLLDEYLNDIDSDLNSLYNSSYNNAYTSEVYNLIWDELSTYFDTTTKEWVEYKNYKDEARYKFKIKLNPAVIQNVISDYVGNEDISDSLEYHGTFLGILGQLFEYDDNYDYLDFRVPEYPDYSDVIKDLNDNFDNYF